jgi:uncharacterized protein
MRIAKLLTGLLIVLTAIFQHQDTSRMDNQHHHTNQLINATSPYLLQHAHNPVDWYEWGEAALAKAKKEDKPILVSIGYSSCHWCHVMERESFEDEKIADIMNSHFICIKVDREERPDIDQVYMEAVQAMGLNGGWPLNVFLTPDQKPFYGGTYYPPQSWVKLLNNIHDTYVTKRVQLEASANELTDLLSRTDLERYKQTSKVSALNQDVHVMMDKLDSAYDTTWGGMDKAPKFVMPSLWMFLLRCYHLTKDEGVLDQIQLTLKKIAMGGIHDQIGGGFARYSVDGQWFAPHFEKMLYDNAQLMSLYAEAYAVTSDREYKMVVGDIFSWLEREMIDPAGGFYSALDADSEGEEGKYYVWTKGEIDAHLGEQAPLIDEYYSVEASGNWEKGQNILTRRKSDAAFLDHKNLAGQQWDSLLRQSKATLLHAREKRIRPGLDDKIITSWNAMMITGLTDAYRVFGDAKYLQAAEKAIRFLESETKDGTTLYRSYKGKPSVTTGFLDDYAFMIQAYVKLYEVTFDEAYLASAHELMDFTMKNFFDPTDGFFFYTHHEGEELISRKKEIFDNVIPSSNSVMARNLMALGLIYDQNDWIALAEKMIGSLSQLIRSEPNYMSNWAIGLLESKHPTAEVVFIGEQYDRLRKEFQTRFYPFSVTLGTSSESSLPLLEGKVTIDNQSTIFVCFNKTCKLPVHTVAEAEKQMFEATKSAQ